MRLGDFVYQVTRLTGIKWMVDKYNKITGKRCNCDKRRKKWNKLKLKRK